jgi:hypothetical protein
MVFGGSVTAAPKLYKSDEILEDGTSVEAYKVVCRDRRELEITSTDGKSWCYKGKEEYCNRKKGKVAEKACREK